MAAAGRSISRRCLAVNSSFSRAVIALSSLRRDAVVESFAATALRNWPSVRVCLRRASLRSLPRSVLATEPTSATSCVASDNSVVPHVGIGTVVGSGVGTVVGNGVGTAVGCEIGTVFRRNAQSSAVESAHSSQWGRHASLRRRDRRHGSPSGAQDFRSEKYVVVS